MADIPEWEPRVRVLEEIATSTKDALLGLKADLAEFRTEIRGELGAIRTEFRSELGGVRGEIVGVRGELRDLRRDMAAGFDTVNQRRERDFRLLFGAIIVVAIGLAGLIARTQHWI